MTKETKILEQVKEKIDKEKTLSLSIKEGSTTSVMSGISDSYITPYALSLNANNAQIGLLSSFSGLVSPLSQLLGSRLMEKYSRRRIIITSVSLQALTWLPIILLGIFFLSNSFVSYLPIILIAFYSLYAIFGAIAGPSWFSLMGDLVPEKIRGKYFGKRGKICGAIALASTIIAGTVIF